MRRPAVIIMPFHLPWNWSADYQRQTCLELAKTSTVIAYMNNDARFVGKRKPAEQHERIRNIIFYQPTYLIPFRRFAIVERANQLINILYLSWRYGRGTGQAIVWIFDPAFWFYPWARYGYPNLISLYDCVDYIWNKNKTLCRRLQVLEKKLIHAADYFFVNSHALFDIHASTRIPDAVVPQGFKLDIFRSAHVTRRHFTRDVPIVGYMGALDNRIDYPLLLALVSRHPEWKFIFWGPVQEVDYLDRTHVDTQLSLLRRHSNVTLGESTYMRDIPSIMKQFTVGIIPYDVRQASVRYSFPMKLFEYFYMGKPVLSTDILELRRYPAYVKIAKNVQEWETYILRAASTPWSPAARRKQREMAVNNSWEKKIAAIAANIR